MLTVKRRSPSLFPIHEYGLFRGDELRSVLFQIRAADYNKTSRMKRSARPGHRLVEIALLLGEVRQGGIPRRTEARISPVRIAEVLLRAPHQRLVLLYLGEDRRVDLRYSWIAKFR